MKFKKKLKFYIENDFPIIRTRKTKTFVDEKAKYEPIIDGKETFKIDTFYVLMDTAVVSMEKCLKKMEVYLRIYLYSVPLSFVK